MKIEYKIGDEIEVTIQKIVPQGLGLAFAENLTVFVPLSAAGDKLRVRLHQIKGKTAFAEIEEIIEPSTERIEPPCPYFGKCGGCDFQQMNYESQLAAKIGIIQDSLKRIGKIELSEPGVVATGFLPDAKATTPSSEAEATPPLKGGEPESEPGAVATGAFPLEIQMIASPKEFEYRSRAQWHLETRKKKIGYFRRNSHDVIDIEHCPKLVPELNKTIADLRANLNWDGFWADRANIEAATGEDDKISLFSPEIMEPTEDISCTVNGERYFYSAQSFFQGNQFLLEQLLETALNGAEGETALDLYCGVGLFTLPLARKFAQVIGVEGNDRAIDFAERNVENARLNNVRFVRDSVGEFLSGHNLANTDFVLLDPPRAGTEKGTILNIVKLKPKQISYVSCDPSILARDLRIFLDSGYMINSITALDLFPQTHHVETVVRLHSI